MSEESIFPNDIFIQKPLKADLLREVLANTFAIPERNICIDDESSKNVDWDKAWIFAYSYKEGDIEWKLDLNTKVRPEKFSAKLEEIAETSGTILYYDRHGIEYDDRVDVYSPKLIMDGAMLRYEEDEEEQPIFFVELKKRSYISYIYDFIKRIFA